MGALALVFAWGWLWRNWASVQFATIGWLFWQMLGVNVAVPGLRRFQVQTRACGGS